MQFNLTQTLTQKAGYFSETPGRKHLSAVWQAVNVNTPGSFTTTKGLPPSFPSTLN